MERLAAALLIILYKDLEKHMETLAIIIANQTAHVNAGYYMASYLKQSGQFNTVFKMYYNKLD